MIRLFSFLGFRFMIRVEGLGFRCTFWGPGLRVLLSMGSGGKHAHFQKQRLGCRHRTEDL